MFNSVDVISVDVPKLSLGGELLKRTKTKVSTLLWLLKLEPLLVNSISFKGWETSFGYLVDQSIMDY